MNTRVSEMRQSIEESVQFILSRTTLRPKTAIILGSGLGDFGETLERKTIISTSDVPHYPRSTVEGHGGNVIVGTIGKIPLLVYQGRVHYYETGKLETILYPIMIAARLGIKSLLVTNAAGGIRKEFRPGDLMLITDQINLTFGSTGVYHPAKVRNRELYDPTLQKLISKVAKKEQVELRRGVYCGVIGPSYETTAEITMIKKIGGDAVGMSTVNEVSYAASLGINVGGISCITNYSTGISDLRLSHAEVTAVADTVREKFSHLLNGIVRKIG